VVALLDAGMLQSWLDDSIQVLTQGTACARQQGAAAAQALDAMQDAETGQRGHLLTMRDYCQEPYQAAEAKVGAVLDRLSGLSAGTPGQQEDVAVLRALVAIKTAERATACARCCCSRTW